MNTLAAFAIEFLTTLLIGFLLVQYIRRPLFRVLVDLCGTEDRAAFWSAFCAVLLIGIPAAGALGYQPTQASLPDSFFLIFRQLGQNTMAFLIALIGVGLIVSFFALVAPKPPKERSS